MNTEQPATRTWYERRPDGKVHGVFTFTDEQILARLERGEDWVPFIPSMSRRAALRAVTAEILSELAA